MPIVSMNYNSNVLKARLMRSDIYETLVGSYQMLQEYDFTHTFTLFKDNRGIIADINTNLVNAANVIGFRGDY